MIRNLSKKIDLKKLSKSLGLDYEPESKNFANTKINEIPFKFFARGIEIPLHKKEKKLRAALKKLREELKEEYEWLKEDIKRFDEAWLGEEENEE